MESGILSLTIGLKVSGASNAGAPKKPGERRSFLHTRTTPNPVMRGEKDRKRSRVERFVCLDIQEDKRGQYNDVRIWTELRDKVHGVHTDRGPGMLYGKGEGLPSGASRDFFRHLTQIHYSSELLYICPVWPPRLSLSLSPSVFSKYTHEGY